MADDEIDNAADPKKVKDKEIKVKNLEATERDDFKFLLANVRGRRFLWRELSKHGLFRISMTGNSETFFREGERNQGLRLLRELVMTDEGAVAAMFAENLSELKTIGGK